MAVLVWSTDGEYLGQIVRGGDELGVSDATNQELTPALNMLLDRPPISDSGGFEVRFGNQRQRFLEFPDEDWLDVAAMLSLPRLRGSVFT